MLYQTKLTMQKIFFTLLLQAVCLSLWAQVKVSGTVKDNKGRALPGASITLVNTYDGAVSDSAGNFSFKTTETGSFMLEAKIMGYKTVQQPVSLAKENLTISFSLKEELNELTAVTVTAGAFEASDKKRGAVLTTLDVLTTGGANADITAALKTLPGAQQVGEQEGLFVRGGTGTETKQFIDGTVVNNPFFASVPDIASRGRFSPALFKGTVFSTGGYSALYGQAMSGAVILESIDLPERSEANASISTVFLGGGFQNLAKNKKSSYGFNYGYTNLLPYFKVVKQKPDYFNMPQFHTADANFRIKTKRGGFIKYYTTFGYSKLGLRRQNIDSLLLKNAFGLENTNWYNNLNWRESLGNGWKITTGASFSIDRNNITNQIQNQDNKAVSTGYNYIDSTNFKLKSTQSLAQFKVVFDKKLAGISTLRFGGEYWYAYTRNQYNQYNSLLKDHFKALFAEADIYITNGLAAKTGVRFEHSSLIKKANIAPRFSLAYKTGRDAQLNVAYGMFYQKPENTQLQYTTNLDYTRATHYIANWQKMTRAQVFRAEIFYKKYDALVKTSPLYNNAGSGYAQGFELYWRDKKTIKNFDYWISYSYLDTKRDFLNYPDKIKPSFAATHTASLVTKRFVTQWKTGFNFTYSYATGRPYYNFLYNSGTGKYVINDQGKTKDFHNLGFSLNYVPSAGNPNAKTFVVLVASVTNVLNYDQVYGYNYNHNGTYKEAIRPPAKQFFFIGCFLSWGVDKTDDAINNNL